MKSETINLGKDLELEHTFKPLCEFNAIDAAVNSAGGTEVQETLFHALGHGGEDVDNNIWAALDPEGFNDFRANTPIWLDRRADRVLLEEGRSLTVFLGESLMEFFLPHDSDPTMRHWGWYRLESFIADGRLFAGLVGKDTLFDVGEFIEDEIHALRQNR